MKNSSSLHDRLARFRHIQLLRLQETAQLMEEIGQAILKEEFDMDDPGILLQMKLIEEDLNLAQNRFYQMFVGILGFSGAFNPSVPETVVKLLPKDLNTCTCPDCNVSASPLNIKESLEKYTMASGKAAEFLLEKLKVLGSKMGGITVTNDPVHGPGIQFNLPAESTVGILAQPVTEPIIAMTDLFGKSTVKKNDLPN